MTVHRTIPADAVVHPSGWARFGPRSEVTRLPLIDRRATLIDGRPLFARLTYRDACDVAALFGARLPTAADLDALHLESIVLPPHPLPAGPEMTSRRYSEEHDATIWAGLAHWDGDAPVAGVGKHWIAGAPRGRAYLMGWWAEDVRRFGSSRSGPGWVQQPSAPGSPGPHDDGHFDYATTTILVRQADATRDTDPAPRGDLSWLDAVMGPIRTVGGWLAEAVATDGAGVAAPVELPPHGWRCSVAELYRDALALGTWRPAGSGYVPRVGDLLISARGGGDPTKGGTGHVERVVVAHPRFPETCGGNEGDTWRRAADVDLQGPAYRGAIEYPPGLGARAVEVTLAEAAAGIRERPGPLAHPRIQAYHAGARRGGSPRAGMPGHEGEGVAVLGAAASDEVAWCASGASSCCYEAVSM